MLMMLLGFLESVKHQLILLGKYPLELACSVIDATWILRISQTPAVFTRKYPLEFAWNVVDVTWFLRISQKSADLTWKIPFRIRLQCC